VCTYQGYMLFRLHAGDLKRIGDFSIGDSHIDFAGTPLHSASRKFQALLDRGFSEARSIFGRPCHYIHRGSGIPLLGSQYFGLVDRNTSLIEIRPITGCNLNCIYCSVDEGRGIKGCDYLVEPDYLVDEFRKLAEFKACEVEAHINPQGEPLLYKPLPELIAGLRAIPQVRRVSIDTNGTLLSKELVDRLAGAGLTQLNISINAMRKEPAGMLAGCPYDASRVLDMALYAKKKTDVILAPVLVPGLNEDEIRGLLGFAKSNDIRICVQNYMYTKHGRNPVKPLDMDAFYSLIASWEQEYGLQLRFAAEDFLVQPTKKLPMPFRKGDRVKAHILMPGRMKGESIAVASDRVIQVRNPLKAKGTVSVEITRVKHNIFYAR
jgi:uncharacterized protein